jgi:hypothetical protein
MTLYKFADMDKPVPGKHLGRPLPSYMPYQGKPINANNVHIISSFDDDLGFFNSGHAMADTDTSMPYIKNEPDDHANDPNQYMMTAHGYAMPAQQQFGQFGNPQGNEGVDPSELTMQNGSGNFYSFGGSQQNLSSSFNMGGAGIADDELLDLGDLNDQGNQGQNMQQNMSNYYPNQRQPTGISMSHQGQMTHVYSHTPEGAPIQSPFTGEFDYNQFRPMGQQFSQQNSSHPSSAQFNQNFVHHAKARQLQTSMERKPSDTRSPMTPKTPAINALHLGSPDSGSFQSQPIRTVHNKQLSGAWNSPGSPYVDSPLSSPGNPSHHAASMSEILKSGKHASLPNTVSKGTSQEESQEAKKKRRRASHNMVERRRRDNINERIQDLSHLVPHHRLEDDKVKKHLSNNSPMSPTLGATSMSPPHATSLLAGGVGRRATAGNITMGIPMDDKEKGPNKGDILNGSVSWTRDLMWALHTKIQQESELRDYINNTGGQWPFEKTEDEKRMETELLDAMEKNDPTTFSYSRGHGSGLRVPKHTTMAGDPLPQQSQTGTLSPQSLSPAFHSGGSETNSGGQQNQAQFWGGGGHAGISFKEEDEYEMDMN